MGTIAVGNAQTFENLLAAYEGESNAHSRYNAFAVKADEEGWHGAASLFRAAARAEQIHAGNHARVIKQLGGEAKCTLHPVEVKSTLKNLKSALEGEQYEIATMYPGFIAEARARDHSAAQRTFHYALEAERTHAQLFGEAIVLVEAGKKASWAGAARAFYVCTVCGFTSDRPEEHERCPVCNALWERFEIVQ
jgi:rubrerythrin